MPATPQLTNDPNRSLLAHSSFVVEAYLLGVSAALEWPVHELEFTGRVLTDVVIGGKVNAGVKSGGNTSGTTRYSFDVRKDMPLGEGAKARQGVKRLAQGAKLQKKTRWA